MVEARGLTVLASKASAIHMHAFGMTLDPRIRYG